MAPKVYVDGQSGTAGLRLMDYLKARDDLEILRIDEDQRRDARERARLINASDVTFLCLPDDASREAVAMLDNPNTTIIDASTAFRTNNDWAYGLPELTRGQREAIRGSRRIANPGCHASAFILLVRPLVEAGLLPASTPLSAFSLTGYSGGGKQMIADYESSSDPRLQSPRMYALGSMHKHLPEMTQHGHLEAAPVFTPVVGNFLKGLTVTVPLHLGQMARGVTPESVVSALKMHYRDEPFIRVMAFDDDATNLDQGFFDVQGCNDTNRADLFVFGNGERLTLMARLDNLGKGAAGAAVQCMNIALGLEESMGLTSGVDA
ncbi:N-acetyl-gamma-glutamyl-phosphate reductase [Larsenimonas suaedae]|uniref:N-acetyl-gamma-glutamyl-phosphate reductase n=1 Tax=Larsenimonas suaedae TaxID=1851019 RepID=A0ABU1GSH0_9GAMM|nr:N-acetyl-gamma-glutamyl-phosphate reductase [Larsenimonas suaedae]MCM2972687.1 N-acetyl-gamma-glutamyl-phosphate reductase [Larsenimonas suaedae]MDR5894516.1 N-acetyl-gamma-glutamyl-phosphate reductase [Larsenimonas suaedae]